MTGSPPAEPFADTSREPHVRGFLHRPSSPARDGLVLTHGAGSDGCHPLLVALASAFAAAGVTVLRCDLPYRQRHRRGPPSPGGAPADREGLRRAVLALRAHVPGRVLLGGHSYGGRQASTLTAQKPGVADALLLLSYPLHPPRRPAEPRTAHFPDLRTPAMFVHGSTDPFGSLEELRAALALIPARVCLVPVEGAGHDLGRGSTRAVVETVVREFLAFSVTAGHSGP